MTSADKMDLDAIDELAWYKILDFLDQKSRLQCRHLSNTIKTYVDRAGLTLHAIFSKPFESEKEDWKAFLKNPDIRFSKLHFSSGDTGVTSPDQLGLTPHHCVNYLHVKFYATRSFNTMSNLLKVDWARNIQTLVWSSYSLALDTPLEQNVSNFTLPCLRKLCLLYKLEERYERNSYNFYNTVGIVNFLLRNIRSNSIELIIVDFSRFDFVEDSTYSMRFSLAEFIQSHARTLQTIIFKYRLLLGDPETYTISPLEFSAIPYGLKYFDVDFFVYLDAESSWFKMLHNSLRHLKTFINKCKNPRDDQLIHIRYPSLLANLCRLNCNTLNYVSLTIQNNNSAVDLQVFSCCNNLEHLHLDIGDLTIAVYLKNLAMLPVSIKSFHVQVQRFFGLGLGGNPISVENSRIALEFEEVSSFQKFNNFVSLWLRAPTTFKNSEQLVEFTKVFLRLRKLDFFQLDDVHLIDQDTSESFQKRKLFFNTLCESVLTGVLKPQSRFEMGLEGKSRSWQFRTDWNNWEKSLFERMYVNSYDVYGYLDLTTRIEHEFLFTYAPDVIGCVEYWPPPLLNARFRVKEKKKKMNH